MKIDSTGDVLKLECGVFLPHALNGVFKTSQEIFDDGKWVTRFSFFLRVDGRDIKLNEQDFNTAVMYFERFYDFSIREAK